MAPAASRKRRASVPVSRPVAPSLRSSAGSLAACADASTTPSSDYHHSVSPLFRCSNTRVQSASSIAAAEKAARLASAVQVSIPFGTVEKYQLGLKILLPETIYGKDEVCFGTCHNDFFSIFFYFNI